MHVILTGATGMVGEGVVLAERNLTLEPRQLSGLGTAGSARGKVTWARAKAKALERPGEGRPGRRKKALEVADIQEMAEAG